MTERASVQVRGGKASRPGSPWVLIGVSALVTLLGAVSYRDARTACASQPLPHFRDCYVGQEDRLAARLADPRRPRPEDLAFFGETDEANYLRTAEQWRLGVTPTDSISWAAPSYLRNPVARGSEAAEAERERLLRSFKGRRNYVSYRSVAFPLFFAPALALTGCNTSGLALLRRSVFALRLAIPLLAAVLVFLVARERREVKSLIVGALCAFDEQLSEATGAFMPLPPADEAPHAKVARATWARFIKKVFAGQRCGISSHF